jgi:hypothetical protein
MWWSAEAAGLSPEPLQERLAATIRGPLFGLLHESLRPAVQLADPVEGLGSDAGWSVGQAAWRLGVSIREYREFEAGMRTPD